MAHQPKKKRVEDEPLPPDAGTKPVQPQRRRVWRACEGCRRKKIKCDGCEPTCSQCASSGSQCTWLQTKDRAALSRHYVQELEARLLHMESLFSQVAPLVETLGQTPNAIILPAPDSDGATSGPSTSATLSLSNGKEAIASVSLQEWRKSVKSEDDVSETFGQLALDEHGHMRWIGGSSTMSLIQSFRALTSSPLHRVSPMEEDPHAPGPSANKLYFPAAVFFGKVHALPGPEEVEYPERDLADKLIDTYFKRFHFLMPVVDKPSFMRDYHRLMDNPLLAQTETAFVALVFAVFACAARIVDDDRLRNNDAGGMGMIYYERALILHYISHASIQIAHVQCFVLLSSFLCSVNCLPQAWLLVGQAVRTAQDLGLHRSPRRLQVSPIEKETRRKVWWSVYTLDRMLALALGRPLGVFDADCDAEPPVDVEDEDLPEYFKGGQTAHPSPSLMAGFIAMTSLYTIAGRVLRQVYALDKCRDNLEPEKVAELQGAVETLDKELTEWCEDLPAVFKTHSVKEQQVSMGAVLCSHYYSILTTLHRNFLPVKSRDHPVAPISPAKAVSSALSCIHLAPSIKNVVPTSHHLAFFIQHLFSSAVIILLYGMHATDAKAASGALDEAKSCLSALESWEECWPGARKCRELLVDLTSTATEAIKSGIGARQSNSGPTKTNRAGSQINNPVSPISSSAPSSRSSMPIRAMKSKPSHRKKSLDSRSPIRRHPTSEHSFPSHLHKRGRDEADDSHVPSPLSFQHTFSSSFQMPSKNSPHSSPSSNSLPSPIMGPSPIMSARSQETSPRLASPSSFTPSQSIQIPQSTQFNYDYNMSPTSYHQPGPSNWTPTNDVDLFSSNSQFGPRSFDSSTVQSVIDPALYAYGGSPEMSMSGTTPPTASFAASGLPFRGLDYIRNYTPGAGGYTGGEQDALWPSFDPGAFGFDPDLSFPLGDFPQDHQDPQHV